jgi:hypothetical protein
VEIDDASKGSGTRVRVTFPEAIRPASPSVRAGT